MKNLGLILVIFSFFIACEANKKVQENQNSTTEINSNEITKIEFSRGACFGFCPIYTYTIVPNAESTFLAKAFNFSQKFPTGEEIEGNYKAKLDSQTWTEILSLVNEIEFTSDSMYYRQPMTDMPSADLTVWYASGKNKYIHDYGMSGTEQLKNLYNYFDKLKNKKEWGIAITK